MLCIFDAPSILFVWRIKIKNCLSNKYDRDWCSPKITESYHWTVFTWNYPWWNLNEWKPCVKSTLKVTELFEILFMKTTPKRKNCYLKLVVLVSAANFGEVSSRYAWLFVCNWTVSITGFEQAFYCNISNIDIPNCYLK